MRTLFLFTLAAASSLHATNLNTGQLGTMQSFSDPIWTIAASPTGTGMNTSGAAFIEQNTYPQPCGHVWCSAGLPASSVANFISSGDCGWVSYTAACGGGTYKFTTTFSVANPNATLLSFSVAGDNRVEVYLNNNFLYGQGVFNNGGDHSGWDSMSPVQNIGSGFLAGTNTLELRVINESGFTGGILVGSVNATPEPATIALTGAALIGLGLVRRRRAA